MRNHSLRCNREKFSSLSNEEGRSTRATTPNKCPITESWPVVIMRLSQPHPHSTPLINITLYLPNTLPDRCSELWTCPSDTKATRGAGELTVGDGRILHPLVLNTLIFCTKLTTYNTFETQVLKIFNGKAILSLVGEEGLN